jgi:hypothetical protein
MSHTGNGVTQLERPTLQEVEQGTYPQESATRVTSAGKVSLTTPQSGGWSRYRNNQRDIQSMLMHALRRQLRERHRSYTVHGNGRRALRKRSRYTTDHDTRRARRRCWRYRRRGRTRISHPLFKHLDRLRRANGYNIKVNLAIGL